MQSAENASDSTLSALNTRTHTTRWQLKMQNAPLTTKHQGYRPATSKFKVLERFRQRRFAMNSDFACQLVLVGWDSFADSSRLLLLLCFLSVELAFISPDVLNWWRHHDFLRCGWLLWFLSCCALYLCMAR